MVNERIDGPICAAEDPQSASLIESESDPYVPYMRRTFDRRFPRSIADTHRIFPTSGQPTGEAATPAPFTEFAGDLIQRREDSAKPFPRSVRDIFASRMSDQGQEEISPQSKLIQSLKRGDIGSRDFIRQAGELGISIPVAAYILRTIGPIEPTTELQKTSESHQEIPLETGE